MERLSQKHAKVNTDLPIKVLQFGEGNFLRAFVDWMIEEMNQKSNFNAGVAVVQPMPSGMIDMFKDQDGLYHVLLNGMEDGQLKSDTLLVHALRRFINPYTEYDAFLETATWDSIEFIISNTTEAGIAVDATDTLEHVQKSFPGKLTAWLYKRYSHFQADKDKGVVILPCELIDRNGDELLKTVLAFCELWALDSEFVKWVKDANTFANTLVDRIVPGFPKDRIQDVYNDLGLEDHVVCEAERFHLWVIEGPEWLNDRIPYKAAGLNIIVTDNMEPYRTRKVKILNGAHTLMVPLALLSDVALVRDAVYHDVLGKYLDEVLDSEIIPTIDMPLEALTSFKNSVLERFQNPYIKHYFSSISLNSISKFKTRVLPSLLRYVELKDKLPQRMVLSLALLIKMYSQSHVSVKDDQDIVSFFTDVWSAFEGKGENYDNLVGAVLGHEALWGQNLNLIPGLSAQVIKLLKNVDEKGVTDVIKEVIS